MATTAAVEIQMRLFIAIEIPDDIKKRLGELQMDIPGVRRVPDSQIHLTLAFLGEVEEGIRDLLADELSDIRSPSFELSLSGTGCFPDRRRPRVLWAGIETEPRLNALAAMVRKSVLNCGIPAENRPFSAHMTLARLRVPAAAAVDIFLKKHEKLMLAPFPVRSFTLFQSRLTQHGAVHIPLKSFELVGEAGSNPPE